MTSTAVQLLVGWVLIAAVISFGYALIEEWWRRRSEAKAARARYDAQLEQWRAPGPGRHRGQQ